MVSVDFRFCFLAFVAVAVVESIPLPKKCRARCPDDYIGNWFEKISLTVNCDFNWIRDRIKLIDCRTDILEYPKILGLYAEFLEAKGDFDDCYGNTRTEIFDLVEDYRKKYSQLSICYNERIVSCRKRARRCMYPHMCKYKDIYNKLLVLIEEACDKYTIDTKPRAIAMPRIAQYSFMDYYPSSSHSKELGLLIETCFNDYRYVYDLIIELPQCEITKKLREEIIDIWIEFDNNRRKSDIEFYPRFLNCNQDQNLIDNIYIDFINNLRPCQMKFASCWFDIYTRYEDLCREKNIPVIDYIDYENFTPNRNIRGLYFPSPRLQEYFSNQIITPRMDYATCIRQWKALDIPCETPEWKRREKIVRELKRLLREFERIINRLIRDCFRRCMPLFDKCNDWDSFDVEHKDMIDEIINSCNEELFPHILEYREQYYNNEECLRPILEERGIVDASRNIIPCNTWGYDMSVYLCDSDLRELIKWIERCFRENYYGPVDDFCQLQFDKSSEEYKLKQKGLKELERIWIDYRKILHELIHRLIKLLRKNKCVIGSKEYLREIKCLREYSRPRFVDLIDRFKSRCLKINDILDTLYKKNCEFKRLYRYDESSFDLC